MRRAFIVLSISAVLAPAHAQTRAPAVTSLALPLSVRTTLGREFEHGCSQSFESVSASASVSLEIDASGATRLTLEGTHTSNMGPSPGRYMAGDHDFSRISEAHRVTWSGSATILPDGIAIRFGHVERAEARWSGYGTLPLPAATGQSFSGQLQCAIAQTDLLPATAVAGERPVSTPLLSCAWVGATQEPFDRYIAEGAPFVLGNGPGVHEVSSTSMWSYAADHEVRSAQ